MLGSLLIGTFAVLAVMGQRTPEERIADLEKVLEQQLAKIKERNNVLNKQEATLARLRDPTDRRLLDEVKHARNSEESGRVLGEGEGQGDEEVPDETASIETNTTNATAPFSETELASSDDKTLTLDDIVVSLDHLWLICCGALVMFMQAGFALLEAGCCRAKNVQNILMKNVMDVCVGTMGWWIFGWAFAYGGPMTEDGSLLKNKFIGSEAFFGVGFMSANENTGLQDGGVDGTATTKQLNWFFQWAFCSAAATIVSGGTAERINFPCYIFFSFVMTSFVYPVVVAWTWCYGWLASVTATGFMDFAGSGIVHMCGGVGALCAAAIVGPRDGRFHPKRMNSGEFNPHNLPLITLGTFILWFGWYGFNCGSTLSMNSAGTGAMAAHVAMNTTIAAATGGLTVLVLGLVMCVAMVQPLQYDLGAMCAGILAGLVSITAGCGNMECGSAMLVGLIGGCIYYLTSATLKSCEIDDPIDAFAVHGTCGAWGVLAAALFDWGVGFNYAHGWSGWSCHTTDGACTQDGWGALFVANILEILAIGSWVAIWTTAVLLPMRQIGILRASSEIQALGLDTTEHSPAKAYSLDDNRASGEGPRDAGAALSNEA